MENKNPKQTALTMALFTEATFIYMASKTLLQEGNESWKIICAATGGSIFLILFIITAYRLFKIIRKKDKKKQ